MSKKSQARKLARDAAEKQTISPQTSTAETDTSSEDSSAAAAVQPKVRFVGIDIVKIFAAFLVVTVHFFLYSGFYSTPVADTSALPPIFLRWFSYNCVPLFMIVTGYLMKNKQFSKKYFLGITRVAVIYIIASIICTVYNHHHLQRDYTVIEWIAGLFQYSDAQYAWYVQYYFNMFLLIPFVNLAYNGLKNQKQKLAMVIITVLTCVFGWSFYVGTDPTTQFKIIPQYFQCVYPFAFYVTGAYIRDYPPKCTLLNKLLFFFGMAASLSWTSLTTYFQSLDNVDNNSVFFSRHYNDYGSWPVFLTTLFIFLLLFDIRIKNKVISKLIKIIGESTYACYLVSYCFDNRFYGTKYPYIYPTFQEKWDHLPRIVCTIFLYSIGLGLIIQSLYNLGDFIVRKIIAKIRASKEQTAS